MISERAIPNLIFNTSDKQNTMSCIISLYYCISLIFVQPLASTSEKGVGLGFYMKLQLNYYYCELIMIDDIIIVALESDF